MQDAKKIVVIGSINMDLVVRTKQMPIPGQTVAGNKFATIPGGKGANQAIAAAHCNEQVTMVARVGNDDFGERLLLGLKANGVNTSKIMVTEGVATGVAMIIVDQIGENAICIAAGANGMLTKEDIDENMDVIAEADVVLLQNEIPLETTCYAIQQAKRHQTPVILNPAPPIEKMDPSFYDVDVLIVNEHELATLTNNPAGSIEGISGAKRASFELINQGIKNIITTMGHHGVIAVVENQQVIQIPSIKTDVVDSTGAGDAFCGAFACCYANNHNMEQALKFANAAGSLACTKFGAQPSMPHLDAIQRVIQRSC